MEASFTERLEAAAAGLRGRLGGVKLRDLARCDAEAAAAAAALAGSGEAAAAEDGGDEYGGRRGGHGGSGGGCGGDRPRGCTAVYYKHSYHHSKSSTST
jgi:hypothetical protein